MSLCSLASWLSVAGEADLWRHPDIQYHWSAFPVVVGYVTGQFVVAVAFGSARPLKAKDNPNTQKTVALKFYRSEATVVVQV